MSRAEKMYGDSPEMSRDEAGKVKVSSKKKESDFKDDAKDGQKEGIPAHARHSIERMQLHSKHQLEHHAHDHGNHGDKKEMHARHLKEHKDMFVRHEAELAQEGKAV